MSYANFDEWAKDHGLSAYDRMVSREGWNAALEAAKAKMPSQSTVVRSDAHRREEESARGWNNCLSVMDERLDSLKAPKEPRDAAE